MQLRIEFLFSLRQPFGGLRNRGTLSSFCFWFLRSPSAKTKSRINRKYYAAAGYNHVEVGIARVGLLNIL